MELYYYEIFRHSLYKVRHLKKTALSKDFLHGSTHGSRGVGDSDTSGLEGGDLVSGLTLATGDNGTGVTHATTGGSSETSNKGNNGLLGSGSLDELSSLLLSGTTDLTDHNDTLGLGVLNEALKAVNEVGAVEGITTNTDDGGLAKTMLGGLEDGLVGEGTGTRNDTDTSGSVDVTGHDTDLAFSGLNDTGAVGADKAGPGLLAHDLLDLDHVVLGNTLSDADNEVNLSLDSIDDGRGSERRGDIDDASSGTSGGLGLLNGVEDRETEVGAATLLGGNTTNHLSAIGNSLLGVEGTVLASKTLANNLGGLIDENSGGVGLRSHTPNAGAHNAHLVQNGQKGGSTLHCCKRMNRNASFLNFWFLQAECSKIPL
mmetsp:Transcript_22445/g.39819  ORF Transcript_22445/g.39819 Transcript_22445/m.39819 type:complete len:372 (+) Transcript_22445:906-2021(+)